MFKKWPRQTDLLRISQDRIIKITKNKNMSKSNPLANLQIVTNCPMCDFKYDKSSIKVIDKKDGIMVLYLNCRQCKSSVAMAIMIETFGITSISIMTDVVEDDIKKIDSGFIKCDDVLEIHKFLENK